MKLQIELDPTTRAILVSIAQSLERLVAQRQPTWDSELPRDVEKEYSPDSDEVIDSLLDEASGTWTDWSGQPEPKPKRRRMTLDHLTVATDTFLAEEQMKDLANRAGAQPHGIDIQGEPKP